MEGTTPLGKFNDRTGHADSICLDMLLPSGCAQHFESQAKGISECQQFSKQCSRGLSVTAIVCSSIQAAALHYVTWLVDMTMSHYIQHDQLLLLARIVGYVA
jgi:hypothetical protein